MHGEHSPRAIQAKFTAISKKGTQHEHNLRGKEAGKEEGGRKEEEEEEEGS